MALDYELEEKRLVRKVDWILMPILTITLGLQYYDKAVLVCPSSQLCSHVFVSNQQLIIAG